MNRILKYKYLFIPGLLFFLFACRSYQPSGGFVVEGTLPKRKQLKKVVLVTEDRALRDTAEAEKRKFRFTGKVDYPVRAAVLIENQPVEFVLANDYIRLKWHDGKPEFLYKKLHVNEPVKDYFLKAESYIEKYKKLMATEVQSGDENVKSHFMRLEDSLARTFADSVYCAWKTRTDRTGLSIIVRDLTRLIGTKDQPGIIKNLYALLPDNEKNGFYGQKIKNYLERTSKISENKLVNFEFEDINGKKYQLQDFRGKMILLGFWATWCGPCMAEWPLLKKIAAHKDKIVVISISIDKDKERWRKKVKASGLPWIHVHYLQKEDLKQKFYISGVPDHILIDENGKIVKRKVSLKEVMEILENK
ncbi:MAG: AhpC/TSA family protein [Chlorobi bacterium]|nr:AhpC/TSA family protein [Chlorobiota bacterium]